MVPGVAGVQAFSRTVPAGSAAGRAGCDAYPRRLRRRLSRHQVPTTTRMNRLP